MKKHPFRIARIISVAVLITLVILLVIFVILGMGSVARQGETTSFPVYVGAVFALIYFSVPILLALVAVVVFRILEKKHRKSAGENEKA